MYLQENAFDEFQIIKICLCEITKNKLHEWVHLVIFQSYNANLNINENTNENTNNISYNMNNETLLGFKLRPPLPSLYNYSSSKYHLLNSNIILPKLY